MPPIMRLKGPVCFFFSLLFILVPAWSFPDAGGIEAARLAAIRGYLQEQGIPFEERPLLADYGGFGSSLYVRFPARYAFVSGPEENAPSFMLAVPLSGEDALREKVETLPFNIQTALAFIEQIRQKEMAVEILVAFLGDEGSRLPRGFRQEARRGLADLVSQPEIPENTALWYLDLAEAPESLFIHHGAGRIIAPLNLLRPLPELSRLHGIPYTLAIHFNEVYKLGLADGPGPLSLTGAQGINALYISGKGTGNLGAEVLAEFLVDYTGALNISTENLDTHFSIIALGTRIFFLSEQGMVLMLLLAASVFLLYLGIHSILFQDTLLVRMGIFARYGWVILVFLVILVLSLQGSVLLFDRLCRLVATPIPPRYDTMGLCFIFAMPLFSLSAPFLDRIPIPQRNVFFGNAALILTAAGVFIAAALDFTLVPLFVWAFLFTFAAILVRVPALIFVFALAVPIQAFPALLAITARGNLKLASSFLEGNFFIILYIALVCLPFVLLIKRGVLLIRKDRPLWHLVHALTPRIVLIGVTGFLLTTYVWRSAANVPPPPVRRVTEGTEAGKSLELDVNATVFLESRIVNVRIDAPGNPVCFDLYLENSRPNTLPGIYSAPAPYVAEGDHTIAFVLGEGPPNPLNLELVLPLNFSGSLRAEALYTEWDRTLDPEAPPETEDYVLRLTRTVRLNTGES